LLARALQPGEVLVTAQHRDDQVETLLLMLMRGAGPAGLAAMPDIAPFGPGSIARPLLAATRAEIEQYARAAGLDWIEDPTNSDTRYSRNFTRHRLMPLIREHWPGADRALARTAANMAEAADLLAAQGDADLAAAADGAALSVTSLRALPAARRRNALRAFIARAGVDMPEASRMRELSGPLLTARADAQPEVRWSNACIKRRAGRLELEIAPMSPAEFVGKSWRWKIDRRLILQDGWLELRDDAQGSIDLDRLPGELHCRARSGGEKLRPSARARTQLLKKLLQSARLTVEERARLPLLFAGVGPKGRLIAAGDRWLDASVLANVKSRRRARLVWNRRG
jgi:tRNA(Ile)-lysidine synthase